MRNGGRGRGTVPAALATAAAALLALTGCTASTVPGGPSRNPPPRSSQAGGAPSRTHHRHPHRHPTSSPADPTGPTTPSHPPAPPGRLPAKVTSVLDSMTLAQQVGQLLMVDCPSTAVSSATSSAITQDHVGSVILDGTTQEGVSGARAVTGQLNALPKSDGAALFIATDQEGGEVQRLQGPGFSTIPSGLDQGRLNPQILRTDATTWGRQLAQAGVNVNLAPVLDVVPAGFGSNPPIGDLDREYGHTTKRVAQHGLAFAQGMADAGIQATVKHFPGLGRVHGNTDTAANVTDDVTTRNDKLLAPYRQAVAANVPFLMVSTAVYTRIDPNHPAAFSRTIVTGMVRDDLGFSGVVVSDDLGVAAQVAGVPVGQRAVDFVAAGGDLVLTVDASQAATMTSALLARAHRSPAFRAKVRAAAGLVLTAKLNAGLLP